MESNRRIIKIIKLNSKGQFAIEAVLLATVLMGVFLLATRQLRDSGALQKFSDVSVTKVKNMSEYGTFKQVCKAVKGNASQTAANCHPNSINRALSSDPQ
jgi:hypothetical protein